MKRIFVNFNLLLLLIYFTGCTQKSSDSNNYADIPSASSFSTTMADPGKENEPVIFKGVIMNYEDMGYPRYQFDLQLDSTTEKSFWFNVVDFPEIEKALSKDLKGRQLSLITREIKLPSLVKIYFPSSEETYSPYQEATPELKEKQLFGVKGTFKEEIVQNSDIYKEWIGIELTSGMQIDFEGNLGIDSSLVGEDVEVTYYYENREEVVDAEFFTETDLAREAAIGKSVQLPTNSITLSEQLARELYKEVLNDMDADEDLFKEFENEPAILFSAQEIDLNNDGTPEILITQNDERRWCYSSNCPLWIFAKKGTSYKKLLFNFFIAFQILENKTKGYNDFVTIEHGSAATSYYNIFSFKNGVYKKSKCVLETYDLDEQGNQSVSYGPCD